MSYVMPQAMVGSVLLLHGDTKYEARCPTLAVRNVLVVHPGNSEVSRLIEAIISVTRLA